MRTTADSPAIDARRFLIDERPFDITVRYLLMIPLLLVAAALTLLPSWRRWWQADEIAVIATGWNPSTWWT